MVIRTIALFVAKRLWRRLHPTYTKDELRRKRDEEFGKTNAHIKVRDRLSANMARRRASVYELKILRMKFKEDMRLIKERCKK